MPPFLTQALLLGLALNMAASGVAGQAVSRRVGAPMWVGVTVGLAVPWLGPAVLALVLVRRPRVWPIGPARDGFRLAGVLCLLAGSVFVFGSSFVEWVQAGASAVQVNASGSWGARDEYLMTATTVAAIVFILLAVGAWAKGGLRFGMPAAFLAAQVAALSLLLVAIAGLAPSATQQAEQFSGGIVQLSVIIGRGAWLALLGCAVILAGSLFLLAKPRAPRQRPPGMDSPTALGGGSHQTPSVGQGATSWNDPVTNPAVGGWGDSGGGSTDGW
jgi:hypothetical protein